MWFRCESCDDGGVRSFVRSQAVAPTAPTHTHTLTLTLTLTHSAQHQNEGRPETSKKEAKTFFDATSPSKKVRVEKFDVVFRRNAKIWIELFSTCFNLYYQRLSTARKVAKITFPTRVFISRACQRFSLNYTFVSIFTL